MSVRMKDIAHTLGISQTTVSHVLRGRDGEFRIGAETARRVRDTVERLGYRPSVLARNLKHHRAYALALAVGDLADPFWPARLKPHHLAPLREERRPFVLVDRTIDRLDVPSVVTDSVGGMRLAVDHLVSRGHRQIGYLGGPTHITTFRDRLAGYRLALAAHGLRPGPYAVSRSDLEGARKAAVRLLRRRPAATAVIAANLWLTMGTLRAAPEDVVVVGFDDFYLADLLRRPVTTVAQPVEDLGREAVRLLLEEVAQPGGNRHVVLPPRLVVREGGST